MRPIAEEILEFFDRSNPKSMFRIVREIMKTIHQDFIKEHQKVSQGHQAKVIKVKALLQQQPRQPPGHRQQTPLPSQIPLDG